MSGAAGGDRSELWRGSYSQVRKEALASSEATNRRRLAGVRANEVGRGGRWLDIGAGDGNLAPELHRAGAGEIVMVEHQHELISGAAEQGHRIVGSAVDLPLPDGSVDVVVVMDVLHHLRPDQLHPALCEVHRVLRPAGHLLVFEPVSTPVRSVLHALLMSPLAALSSFSRHKRRMVEEEQETLVPWLRHERQLPRTLTELGFAVELERRGALSGSCRARRDG